MALLNLNATNPGIKRPIGVVDLNAIWEGLNNALASGVYATPRIICGFDYDEETSNFTAGVIAFQGKLYLNDGSTNPIPVDGMIYAHEDPSDDQRVMGDGTFAVFSFIRVVNTTAAGGTLIGQATLGNVTLWKAPKALAPGSVGRNELANQAVVTAKIGPRAVTNGNMADSAVGFANSIGGNSNALLSRPNVKSFVFPTTGSNVSEHALIEVPYYATSLCTITAAVLADTIMTIRIVGMPYYCHTRILFKHNGTGSGMLQIEVGTEDGDVVVTTERVSSTGDTGRIAWDIYRGDDGIVYEERQGVAINLV